MTVKEFLNDQGYVGPIKDQFKEDSVYYHRKVDGTNHQIQVYHHTLEHMFNISHIFDVEITFECTNGIWVNNKFYSMSERELMAKLPELATRLYNTVEVMGGNKDTYEGGTD